MTDFFIKTFKTNKPVIGMLHLRGNDNEDVLRTLRAFCQRSTAIKRHFVRIFELAEDADNVFHEKRIIKGAYVYA